MKNTWELIQETVEHSTLGKTSKSNVLRKLDTNLGKYSICYRVPKQVNGLDEEEKIVYNEVVGALNEATKAPKIKNDKQYDAVMQDIFNSMSDVPSREVSKQLVVADLAHDEGDFETVNKIIAKVWSKL